MALVSCSGGERHLVFGMGRFGNGVWTLES